MNQKTLALLNELLEHLEYYNMLSPFPVYGTEYVADVRDRIKYMEKSNINYDELPVAACKYCKSLHIENDEVENDICMKCGSVNEIQVFSNIDEYLEFKNED